MANQQLQIPVGTRFGELITTSDTYQVVAGQRRRTYVNVRCECGAEKRVRPDALRAGSTISCGHERGKTRYTDRVFSTPGQATHCARDLCGVALGTTSYTPSRRDSIVYGEWFCSSTCASSEAAVRKQHVRRDSGVDRERVRANLLKKKYGITIEEWDALYEAQDGRCAICPASLTEVKACVDHCHTTGAIRGILCSRCNLVIGAVSDDPQILLRAAHYVAR